MPQAPGYDNGGGGYPPPGPGYNNGGGGYPPPGPGYPPVAGGAPYPPVEQQPGSHMMQPLMSQQARYMSQMSHVTRMTALCCFKHALLLFVCFLPLP